jgi:hypothetical protein
MTEMSPSLAQVIRDGFFILFSSREPIPAVKEYKKKNVFYNRSSISRFFLFLFSFLFCSFVSHKTDERNLGLGKKEIGSRTGQAISP